MKPGSRHFGVGVAKPFFDAPIYNATVEDADIGVVDESRCRRRWSRSG
jgi:hypothetical protein